jgi:hypothetical protein
MMFSGSLSPSALLPPTGHRFARADDRSQQARALQIEAERCFRLAQGAGSLELADELEALGRVFEAEAEELAAGTASASLDRTLATAA